MPDAWSILHAGGALPLNASFRARQYDVGGVDSDAVARRDAVTVFARRSDALRAPEPFELRGVVWSDANDIGAAVAEVRAIASALASVTGVQRVTAAGTFTYSNLIRAATPEVAQNGDRSYLVTILVWPSETGVTFEPADTGGPAEITGAAVTFESFNAGTVTRNINVPNGANPGDLVIIAMYCQNDATIDSAPAGAVTLGAAPLQPIASIPPPIGFAVTKLWVFAVPGASAASVASFETTAFYGVVSTVVLAGPGLSTADVSAVMRFDQPGGTPQEIDGVATTGGTQLFFGGLTNFGGF